MERVRTRLWFPFGIGDNCQVRLVCLPHAGAGASAFLSWRQRSAAAGIGVCAVQPPGRETRLGEAAYVEVGALVHDLVPALLPLVDRPTAIYGHSLGALTAFELARGMRAAGLPAPVHLVVSGRPAPQLEDARAHWHDLPAGEMVRQLRILGGTSEEILSHPELVERFLPGLRSDFAMNENYRHAKEPPLAIPLTVLGGTADPRATRPELAAWQEQTTASFHLRTIDGGHFAVLSRAEEVLGCVARQLGP
jgi:surfactin synthase thioesterase subunit